MHAPGSVWPVSSARNIVQIGSNYLVHSGTFASTARHRATANMRTAEQANVPNFSKQFLFCKKEKFDLIRALSLKNYHLLEPSAVGI